MKTPTPIKTRLASFAAALLMTLAMVHSLASYGLPPVSDAVVASACQCR